MTNTLRLENNRIRIGGQQAGKPDGELLFLFIPWWLYPFRAERALIDGTVIVGRRELRDAAVRLFLAILALAVGLGSALYFQRVLSEVSVLSGAKVETTPYSLTHTYIGDLSLLGLMGGLAALLYLLAPMEIRPIECRLEPAASTPGLHQRSGNGCRRIGRRGNSRARCDGLENGR